MYNIRPVLPTFMVKAGMTPQDVIDARDATPQQKKLAYAFDSDGELGYSQREADVFNATAIQDRGKLGVALFTKYKDGTEKKTKFVGDIADFKYAPKGEVEPYEFIKATTTQNDKTCPREDKIKYYRNGSKKFEKLYYPNGQLKSYVKYYRNGNVKLEKLYYQSGQMKSREKYNSKGKTTNYISYYEYGIKEHEYIRRNIGLFGIKSQHEKYYYGNGMKKREIDIGSDNIWLEKTYYPNGEVKEDKKKDPDGNTTDYIHYYEDGMTYHEYIYRQGKGYGSKYYYNNGQLANCIKANEQKVITDYIEYYKDGIIKLEYTYSKKNGSDEKLYDANGQLIKHKQDKNKPLHHIKTL